MVTTDTYSSAHLLAFMRYREKGWSVTTLDDQDLTALLEDKNFTDEIRKERARRAAPLPVRSPVQTKEQPLQIARFKKNESAETFFDRAAWHAAPLYLVKGFVDQLTELINTRFNAMNEKNVERNTRLDHLEAENAEMRSRINVLEARESARPKGLSYCGVWVAGATYEPGEFATWAGSMWHANTVTNEKPGEGSTWTLAVNRGRDGKDADKRGTP